MTGRFALVAVVLAVLVPSSARAQTVDVRGFAEAGVTTFTASQSFKAVLGSSSGPLFGGGGGVVVARHIFIDVTAARFQKDGSRVFVFNGQVFNLNIPTTIRVTPLDVSGGYRFASGSSRVVPYAGGGVSWRKYEETSDFAAAGENVNETFHGYHVVGGAEFRVNGWFGVAGEAKYTAIPNALGKDPNGVSAQYGEKDLGGGTFVVKAVLGK